ncbi:hypothetical protein [Limibacterium fermenti]|uniref:hypothetical protein n=1 Tax=Limibacterium fermenti TaxID=3229863 RepID=UPI000E8554A0|nr:hypothetical protein [Porphyromonadaceae bacterium]
MRKYFSCKIEELPVIADFLLDNLTRDLADFTAYSPLYTAEFVDGKRAKVTTCKSIVHSSVYTVQKKLVTDKLETLSKGLHRPLNEFEGYFNLASGELDILSGDSSISDVREAINNGNTEGILTDGRILLATIARNQTVLETKGLKPEQVTSVETVLGEIDTLNKEQNALHSGRTFNSEQNIDKFNDLYLDMRSIVKTGKAIYRGKDEAKLKDYTFSQLLKRVRIERISKAEKPKK